MAFPFDAQWNSLMQSSVFAEDAVLSVDGEDIPLRGIFISGTFKEESPAAYSPDVYVDREFFRVPLAQLGNVARPLRSTLTDSKIHLPERNRRFRVQRIIGKDNGDIEMELQEVENG